MPVSSHRRGAKESGTGTSHSSAAKGDSSHQQQQQPQQSQSPSQSQGGLVPHQAHSASNGVNGELPPKNLPQPQSHSSDQIPGNEKPPQASVAEPHTHSSGDRERPPNSAHGPAPTSSYHQRCISSSQSSGSVHSSGSHSSGHSSHRSNLGEKVTLLVDGKRFNVNPHLFTRHPNTMLGR